MSRVYHAREMLLIFVICYCTVAGGKSGRYQTQNVESDLMQYFLFNPELLPTIDKLQPNIFLVSVELGDAVILTKQFPENGLTEG